MLTLILFARESVERKSPRLLSKAFSEFVLFKIWGSIRLDVLAVIARA